jgi:arylsulfatase A-like enzyme
MPNQLQNVLLVTIDSLRYDATDRLDLSLSDTISFDRAFATGPGTSPSFPGILTGTLPLSYGGLGPLTDDRPRLATYLRDAGLTTGGFQCNPFLSRHFNYDRGFDAFEDYQHPLMGVATRLFPRGIELDGQLGNVDDILHLTDAIKWVYSLVAGKPRPYVGADVITDDAITWLDNTDGPFFCWAHYMDVHHPCFPPREYRAAYEVADIDQSEVTDWYSALVSAPDKLADRDIEALQRLYWAAIEYTGDQIDRLFKHLTADNRLDETLVIVTSDHGELFGDHGEYGKPERMYDELLRVPLMIANGPKHLADATGDLVSLLDIPPLIHDMLDMDVPDEYEGCIPGNDAPREYAMAEHEVEGTVVIGARSSDWLYEADEIRDEHRLFDLRNGFKQIPTAQDSPAEAVKQAVLERLATLDIDSSHLDDQVEGDVEARLEDLGYL